MDKNACFLSSQNEDVVESELGVQKSTITIAPERSQTGFYTTSCIRTRIYISMAKHRTFFFDLLNPTFLGPLGSKESFSELYQFMIFLSHFLGHFLFLSTKT